MSRSPDTAAAEWFYSDEGRACGPYPTALLLELLRRTGNPADAIVRAGRHVPWSRLQDVPELAHALVHGAPVPAAAPRTMAHRQPGPGRRWDVPRSSYVAQHWRGELGLAWSFWLNYVGLGFLFGTSILGTSNRIVARFDSGVLLLCASLALLLAWAACAVWLKVGTWRASSVARARRPSAWIGITRFVLVCSWISLGVFVPARVMALVRPTTNGTLLPVNGATVRAGGTRIDFFGPVTAQATASLGEALAAAPAATLIRLQSGGGLVGEGRRMASLIRARHLATEAVGTCASACTLMFMAGEERRLAPGAQLGFHSYRSPTATPLQLLQEEATDENTFRAAGVPTSFIQHTFATPPSGIWFPTLAELVGANILTGAPVPTPALPAAVTPPGARPEDPLTAMSGTDLQPSIPASPIDARAPAPVKESANTRSDDPSAGGPAFRPARAQRRVTREQAGIGLGHAGHGTEH